MEDYRMAKNSFDCSGRFAIGGLVSNRCRELGLDRAGLIRRTGYKNVAKGLRRLDDLFAGELERTNDLIRALPGALHIPGHAVETAVAETRHQVKEYALRIAQAEEAAWRAAFVPHAVILTDRTRPQPIFVAALVGVERLLRIDFDLGAGRASYINQALNGVRLKLAGFKSEGGSMAEELPAFGRPIGLVVNYSPDRAVRFDINGNAIEILQRAYRIGQAYLSHRKRPS
jgi:hypothetical protein